MPSTPAADAVLSTYELLEQILLSVPIRHLCTAKGVCSTWQSVISQSLAIRKKMFLTPTATPLAPHYNDEKPWAPEYAQTVQFLPPFSQSVKLRRRRCKHDHGAPGNDWAVQKIAFVDTASVPKSTPREDNGARASFLDMFLTQPPVTVVDVLHYPIAEKIAARSKELCSIRNSSGVTMEDLGRAVRVLSRTHRAVGCGDPGEGKIGFTLVDPHVPEKLVERLKPGERFGGCAMCEAAEKKREGKI